MKKIYWIIIAAILLFFYFSKKIINFYTELLWYASVNYQSVIYKIIITKIMLFLIFAAVFFLFVYLNIYFAEKLKPKITSMGQNILESFAWSPYLKNLNKAIVVFVLIFFSFVFAYQASLKWDVFQQFLNPISFGEKDPIFLKDIGFYIFSLPALKFIYSWLMFLLIISALLVLIIYFTSSAVQYIGKKIYFTSAARAHLFGIISALFFLRFIGYKINLYDLLYSEKGVVFGATYIDIYGYKPVYYFLAFLCFLCFAAAVVNIFSKKAWNVFVIAVIVFIFSSIIGPLYPAALQKFIVKPNEINKETKFIQYNIKYTRAAYNINNIKEREFPADENISRQNIIDNEATIKNIRLWDYEPILATYSQLQEIRTYYKFADVDNDRYYIKGKYTQVMLSPRELSSEKIPSRIWINEHLTYTHGYGLCMGPVNRVTKEGLPEFFVKDIPPVHIDDIKLDRPEIYFGELSNQYCFVDTKNNEFDYPAGDKNVYTEYQADAGIPIKSIFRRLLFAMRFSEPKIFFSQDITNNSKLMYHRNVLERVRLCAPLVYFDKDIYMVIGDDGNLYWVAEGFTFSNLYPYSYPANSVNYIRNSVKAVVNAYTGKIDYYISDPEDPLIKVQNKIFPAVFKDMGKMPSFLRSHIRYPASLFKIQANIFSIYHMTDTRVFYNKEDLWRISQKISGKSGEQTMEPYYTILKFPGTEKEEFILMVPFSPSNKSNMIAWMAARCDYPNYGGIISYRFPKRKLVYGPNQIDARIDQDPEISKQLTLWGQGGSKVIRGSLLVIPIEESLLYVEPIYLAAEVGQLPELKRIVVSYKDKIAMEENLENALSAIFKIDTQNIPKKQITSVYESAKKPSTSFKELINLASDIYDEALNAQRRGNWALYGEKISDLKHIIEELKKNANK